MYHSMPIYVNPTYYYILSTSTIIKYYTFIGQRRCFSSIAGAPWVYVTHFYWINQTNWCLPKVTLFITIAVDAIKAMVTICIHTCVYRYYRDSKQLSRIANRRLYAVLYVQERYYRRSSCNVLHGWCMGGDEWCRGVARLVCG